MMKKLHCPLLMLLLLVTACASLPSLVSLETSLSNPTLVTIYKAPV